MNDDTFELNEQRARELTDQMDNRVPSSLRNQPTNNSNYEKGRFAGGAPTGTNYMQDRPVRDTNSKVQNSN